MATCQEYFNKMPAAFQPSVAGSLRCVYQFDLSGDGGGQWIVSVQDGQLSVTEGRHEKPDVTLAASAKDYMAIAEGKMNSVLALATGKFKIKGNMAMAMKLEKLFKR